jgi:hypothetical protein
METKTSKGKEIRIPGPDHPITISPAEGKVRVRVAGRIVAESAASASARRGGISTCLLLAEQRRRHVVARSDHAPTLIVRTRVIVRTTTFPSADQNRNTPFGLTKYLMRQLPALESIWRFIPRGLMQSK